MGLTCNFYTAPNCAGAGTEFSYFGNTISTAGAWLTAGTFGMQPVGAVSARCGFYFGNLTGSTADVDAISLRGTGAGLIFADGFESGNTSQWP